MPAFSTVGQFHSAKLNIFPKLHGRCIYVDVIMCHLSLVLFLHSPTSSPNQRWPRYVGVAVSEPLWSLLFQKPSDCSGVECYGLYTRRLTTTRSRARGGLEWRVMCGRQVLDRSSLGPVAWWGLQPSEDSFVMFCPCKCLVELTQQKSRQN